MMLATPTSQPTQDALEESGLVYTMPWPDLQSQWVHQCPSWKLHMRTLSHGELTPNVNHCRCPAMTGMWSQS